ncbi:hypothetical protein [Paenisporosarcina sp. NPDC076898]
MNDDLKFEYEMKIKELEQEVWFLKHSLELAKINRDQLELQHSIESRRK